MEPELIVNEILADLSDRKGFDIYELDEDIQEEIKQTWIGIIEKHLKQHGNT